MGWLAVNRRRFSITVVATPLLQMSVVGSLDPANGSGLHQSMVLGADGNFYGTCTMGGASSGGTVYEMKPGGTQTIVHAFGDGSVPTDGAQPMGLSFGADGALYGTTSNGGSAGQGTVFKIAQGTESILHHFGDGTVSNDGAVPATSLLQGTDGNFYSVSKGGGTYGQGTYFSMTPSGSVGILYSFGNTSPTIGPASPDAPLIQDPNLNTPTFYGTTKTDIINGGRGTAFAAVPTGYYYTVRAFDTAIPPFYGCRPHGPVTMGSDFNLYGIASAGGTSSTYFASDPTNPNVFGLGTVYQLTAGGTQTDLHNFGDGTVGNDGCNTAEPNAPLVQGLDGNFYGVTPAGGSANQGCFFQITPTGSMLVLHSFGDGTLANDGTDPGPVLLLGADGHTFYGVTQKGGANGNGVIYKFVVGIPPVFSSTSYPPSPYLGIPYSYTFIASGYPSPTFSFAPGSFPPGLTLSNGVLSGTPTATGFHAAMMTASNGIAPNATQSFIINVLQSYPPAITNGPPTATGTLGVSYTFNYTATGTPTPTFSVTTGALPPGLSLSTTGAITGTPTAAGIYTGTVTATNGLAPDATQAFTITVGTSYTAWVGLQGLTGNQALPTAVVSPDGMTNLMKYAQGLNPFTTYNPGTASLPVVQAQNYSGVNYLSLTFTGVATDVTYTVQASSDLTGTWSTVYASTPGTAPGTVVVQDTQAVGVSPQRYMRLIVSQ